jgi:hypothetical protein
MHTDKIRRLEILIEEQNKKINNLTKESLNYKELLEQKLINQQELARLRKLQWEEDHERINLDDR